MNRNLTSVLQLGTVAALISFAGVLGGFDQPKDKPAAKETAGADKKADASAAKHDFKVDDGRYVETCSCMPPCACELIGPDMSCKGVAAFEFKSAKYNGQDISGTKMAYAVGVGKWVHIYIDQKDPKKHDAALAFSKAALNGFGPVTLTKDADIKIDEKADKYTVSVDGGKTMQFETEPVMGGDEKTPITYSNVHDPVHPVMMQGSAISASYKGSDKDGEKTFKLDKGRNAFFNNHLKSSGSV
jgi:hypothetical protein